MTSRFHAINQAAGKRGLRFLLIGGHAVNAHGYSRKTFDIDLLINRDDKELWRELMLGLGFECLHEHETFIQFASPETPQVDLMCVRAETFAKQFDTSEVRSALELETRVPSLFNLLALKLHAARHAPLHRRHKDLIDIIALNEANRVEVTSDSFRNLCHKFGTPELYAEILKANRRP